MSFISGRAGLLVADLNDNESVVVPMNLGCLSSREKELEEVVLLSFLSIYKL